MKFFSRKSCKEDKQKCEQPVSSYAVDDEQPASASTVVDDPARRSHGLLCSDGCCQRKNIETDDSQAFPPNMLGLEEFLGEHGSATDQTISTSFQLNCSSTTIPVEISPFDGRIASKIRGSNRVFESLSTASSSEETHKECPTMLQQITLAEHLTPLRSLKDQDRDKLSRLFSIKLQACRDFANLQGNQSLAEKEEKNKILTELIEFIKSGGFEYTESMVESVFETVESNIFRSFAPMTSRADISPAFSGDVEDDEEFILDALWPSLQLIYELFLRFLISNDLDVKLLKKHINAAFIQRILELFASGDPRERDYLKNILHRIYGKIMILRLTIRKAIHNIFLTFIYEQNRFDGIAELLEILGSIISGFALPLKKEHKVFLEKALIPLHKAKSIMTFHQQLSYCMTQYIEKNSQAAEVIILGLLKYWPVTDTHKEVLFLNELEEVLDITPPDIFRRIMLPLYKQLAYCIQSPHFQVAERVLFYWDNEHIVNLFNENKETLFPIIIQALYKNSKEHWNRTVHGLTYNVSKLLVEADSALFDHCSEWNMSREKIQNERSELKRLQWAKLESDYQKSLTSVPELVKCDSIDDSPHLESEK